MEIETAIASRVGDRETNQDRADIVVGDTEVLIIVADGMGGHADGERAAETCVESLTRFFKEKRREIPDVSVFLEKAILEAHRATVQLGARRPSDLRPRTTCVVGLVYNDHARWAHVGDSRAYYFNHKRLRERTRDHSAVETLYREGRITEEQMLTHPLRNYVEQCLGGEPESPEITISPEMKLEPGDTLVLSSDGFWSPLDEKVLGELIDDSEVLQDGIDELAQTAEAVSRPHSDNVTAAAIRLLAPTAPEAEEEEEIDLFE